MIDEGRDDITSRLFVVVSVCIGEWLDDEQQQPNSPPPFLASRSLSSPALTPDHPLKTIA